ELRVLVFHFVDLPLLLEQPGYSMRSAQREKRITHRRKKCREVCNSYQRGFHREGAWNIMVASPTEFLHRFFQMTDKIVVLSTCASEEEADRLARMLVERRLAACVNVLPNMRSVYRWNGAIESAVECLLVIKSCRAQFDSLRAALEAAHSYELPEALA